MLTLLTATGARPKAWSICEKLAMCQTYASPVRWIIVDDGPEAQPISFSRDGWELVVVRREPFWEPGQNTQALNLLAGMDHVNPGDRLVIWEDDDHMPPGWLESVHEWLNSADLVGESFARYYNVHTRKFRQLNNNQHSSLCSTAMKGPAIEAFRRELIPGVQFIDLNLWRNFKGKKFLSRTNMVTGIKGLPGRGGIGMGHKASFNGDFDHDWSVLLKWVGTDRKLYE